MSFAFEMRFTLGLSLSDTLSVTSGDCADSGAGLHSLQLVRMPSYRRAGCFRRLMQGGMRMTLADKVSLAMNRMAEVLTRFGPAVAVGWTGGKDSTTVLALWRNVLRRQDPGRSVQAINLDTGCKFPEVLDFRDRLAREWDIALHIVHPRQDLAHYPLAVDPLQCCRDLKIAPLNEAIVNLGTTALLTGVRADENPDRAKRPWLEDHGGHLRAAPLLEWTELDIWTFLVRENIPWCVLYDRGYRSLGCIPCTSRSGHGERSGRDGRKEVQMDHLHSLGYF